MISAIYASCLLCSALMFSRMSASASMLSDLPARVEISEPAAPGAELALMCTEFVGYFKTALDELASDDTPGHSCVFLSRQVLRISYSPSTGLKGIVPPSTA